MVEKVLVHSWMTRILHWLFALSLFILIVTGFYIHWPINIGSFYNTGRNVKLQISVGFVASGLVVIWLYHHIVTQAYTDILLRKKDLKEFKGLFKYYFFLTPKPPHHGKYNAGQKLIFCSWVVVFAWMFLSGLVLYAQNYENIIPFPVLVQKTQFYHYMGALWFLGTVPLHIYLSITEDPAKLQAIFTGWLKKP